MTPEQFTYWFQGFVELGNGSVPSFEQWKSIREHLATVFVKVTPPIQNGQANDQMPGKSTLDVFLELSRAAQNPPPGYPWHGYTVTC